MAYTPTVWECGDIVTAEKLNKIEQGIAENGGGSEPLAVSATPTEQGGVQLDKTWQEINDAYPNAYFVMGGSGSVYKRTFDGILSDGGNYAVALTLNGTTQSFTTTSADGYPATEGSNQPT